MLISNNRLIYHVRIIIAVIITLLIIGSIFIYSASSVFALATFKSAHFFVRKQLIGIMLGIGAFIALRLVPLTLVKKYCPLAFWFSFFLTGLTHISFFALRIHGSSRWLKLSFFSFQPSELLKLAFIIYFAYLLAKKEFTLNSFVKSYMPLLFIIGMTSILLLKQPDFGLTITLVLTALIMMLIAQVPLRYLIWTLFTGFPLVVLLIFTQTYRLKRILTFLNPWSDPQGAGFQIIQSLIAIGSGSWSGIGISNSRQKFFYLPMQHTDFIFSIIAEEIGFVGSLIIILLYGIFIYFGLRIAAKLHDTFSSLTVVGFTVLIGLQALINFAVTTGLAPTKGIGLPFISYGNTNLICSLAMLGLITNIVHHAHRTHQID